MEKQQKRKINEENDVKKSDSNNVQQLSLFGNNQVISNDEELLIQKVNQRRRQILVHSCLYYQLNDNLISDFQYDKFARELAKLQIENKDILSKCVYNEYFKDFGLDGCYSGFNLPHNRPEIVRAAERLLWYRDNILNKQNNQLEGNSKPNLKS